MGRWGNKIKQKWVYDPFKADIYALVVSFIQLMKIMIGKLSHEDKLVALKKQES